MQAFRQVHGAGKPPAEKGKFQVSNSLCFPQLKNDVAELAAFLEQAKSARVKGVLTKAKAEAEREIVNLEMKARIAAERQAAGTAGDAKR